MTAQIKNRGLGRGMSSLLSDSSIVTHAEKELNALNPNSLNEIPVTLIATNPFQPRTHFDETALQELAESIKVQGIIQPITVRQLAPNSYQLISGERRLQASKKAGLSTIPAYVRLANDQQMLEMALIENIQRENLNALEVALSYQRMISEVGLKQEELGDRVGKNRTTVTNYLRLLKLPIDIQAGLRDDSLSMGHARALIPVDDEGIQLAIYHRIIQEGWSVRRTEEAVKELNAPKIKTEKAPKAELTNYKGLSDKLSKLFGSKVNISSANNGSGEIKIPFGSETELIQIMSLLKL